MVSGTGEQNEVLELHLTISGHVQGVFFRRTVQAWAGELGLGGFVQNRDDGAVYICAQGTRADLETLRAKCYLGSELARVERVHAQWCETGEHYSSFEIM